MKKSAIKLLIPMVFALVAPYANAQTISVTGSIDKNSIKLGKIGKGSIILKVPKELHINSNKPTSEFMIATELKLTSNQAKNLKAIFPKGKNMKFEFSEAPINVYVGKTVIPFTFKIPKNFRGKMLRIQGWVTYQACTNEVCYQPQTTEIVLKAPVIL